MNKFQFDIKKYMFGAEYGIIRKSIIRVRLNQCSYNFESVYLYSSYAYRKPLNVLKMLRVGLEYNA